MENKIGEFFYNSKILLEFYFDDDLDIKYNYVIRKPLCVDSLDIIMRTHKCLFLTIGIDYYGFSNRLEMGVYNFQLQPIKDYLSQNEFVINYLLLTDILE